MTITRTINGTPYDIDLTPQELFDAYCEQEHKWDVSNVRDYLRANTSYSPTDEDIDSIAYNVRHMINKYDLSMHFALDEAVSEYGFEEEEAS